MVCRLLVGLLAAGLLLIRVPAFVQPPAAETTVQKNQGDRQLRGRPRHRTDVVKTTGDASHSRLLGSITLP